MGTQPDATPSPQAHARPSIRSHQRPGQRTGGQHVPRSRAPRHRLVGARAGGRPARDRSLERARSAGAVGAPNCGRCGSAWAPPPVAPEGRNRPDRLAHQGARAVWSGPVDLAVALVGLAGLLPVVSASSPHTLTIKDCEGTFTGKIGDYCTITESNVPRPVGSRVSYYGPVVGSAVFVSSTAVIDIAMAALPAGTARWICEPASACAPSGRAPQCWPGSMP